VHENDIENWLTDVQRMKGEIEKSDYKPNTLKKWKLK